MKDQDHQYSAAFIGARGLVEFPLDSATAITRVSVAAGLWKYGFSGEALYGVVRSGGAPRLVRLDLADGSVRTLGELRDFRGINSIAVSRSEDKLLLAGLHTTGGQLECGIFLYSRGASSLTKVVAQSDERCDYVSSWRGLSLSPDATKAVAVRQGAVELLDLSNGESRLIANAVEAAWAPSGEWIAIVEGGPSLRVRVLRAPEFTTTKDVGKTDSPTLAWSPDSRYLLTWRSKLACGGYFGTFYALDVLSGEARAIKSSSCKVNLMTHGWIANRVAKKKQAMNPDR